MTGIKTSGERQKEIHMYIYISKQTHKNTKTSCSLIILYYMIHLLYVTYMNVDKMAMIAIQRAITVCDVSEGTNVDLTMMARIPPIKVSPIEALMGDRDRERARERNKETKWWDSIHHTRTTTQQLNS
jgi:hypothetical protein